MNIRDRPNCQKYLCDKCPSTFSKKYIFQRHEKSYSKTSKKKYGCKYCNLELINNKNKSKIHEFKFQNAGATT